MHKVNTGHLEEHPWASPQGQFRGSGKQVSEALGRDPGSTDLRKRHPFDVEILRVPPGHAPYPYHAHSAQWEFYHVVSGRGTVRHARGRTAIEPGDAFIFEPGQPHALYNDGEDDLIVTVIADNPIGDCFYYPDSGKWGVPVPSRQFVRGQPLDYFDGEE